MPNSPTYKETLLAKDANLARWYNNLKHGSPVSADGGLRRVGRICKLFNTTPAELAQLSVKDATNLLLDLVTKLEEDNMQPTYMSHFVKVMKSWFSFNGIHITERIKIPDSTIPSKVSQEVSPMPDQVRRLLDTCGLKQKVEAMLVGFCGLRIETIGNYTGKDGLRIRDLPELQVVGQNVEFSKIPTLVIVRRNLSKAGHSYFTFMNEEGCSYLKNMLEYRIARGEKLTPDSPIVTSLKYLSDSLKNNNVEHISSRMIGLSIRTEMRRANFDWRPYILRTYFGTRMMMAEADGMIIRDWRQFWMGHKGDIEHVYTLNKRLPEDLLEKMREAFARASDKHLATVRRNDVNIDTVKAQFNRQFLEIAGFSSEAIEKMGNLGTMTAEEMNSLLRENSKKSLGLNGNAQKVISSSDLEWYINEGWEYVKDISPDKTIVCLPKR